MEIILKYKTLISFAFGLSLLYFFKGYIWIPYVIAVLTILSILFPEFLVFFDRTMQRGINVIGKLLSNIILVIFYYVILFPFSLISKIFSKKDSLQLKKPIDSNFKETNKSFEKDSFRNLW